MKRLSMLALVPITPIIVLLAGLLGVGSPGPVRVTNAVSFGDTLVYTLTVDTAPHATGYLWKVVASKTNAVWNGLPTAYTATSANTITFQARGGPVPPWDSATFTATVKATNLVSTSPDSSMVIWSIKRAHVGNPGAVTVDSSQAHY